MKKKKKIEVPQAIIDAGEYWIENFGNNFDYLGEYQGKQVWVFKFTKFRLLGFPVVYLYDGKTAERIYSDYALRICSLFN